LNLRLIKETLLFLMTFFEIKREFIGENIYICTINSDGVP
jgi:hypothetical protein